MGAGPTARKDEGEQVMNGKNARQDRKIKLMTEEADARKLAEEQAKSIRKMYEDRDKKAKNAKRQLVNQLDVTVDKYRTANGVMAALDVVRSVKGNANDPIQEIAMAKTVATEMARMSRDMRDKAQSLAPEEMGQLCDDFYDKEFSEHDSSIIEMVDELMALQLCQNVGPSAEDITSFLSQADAEIEKARKDLIAYCENNSIDFNELCGPHGDCYDCLCESCEKDCKDHKIIKEGQSAYDVCENFIEKE